MRDKALNQGLEQPIVVKNPKVDRFNHKDIQKFEHMQILERIKERTETIDYNKKNRYVHVEDRAN